MDLEIKTLEWPQVDPAELAAVAHACRAASPFNMAGQDRGAFEHYVIQNSQRWPGSRVLAAYQDGVLVGWLGLNREDPLTFEIWRWQPFILPSIDPGPVAEGLLLKAVEIASESGAQSLEVVCGFSKEQLGAEAEAYYQRQLGWYQACGIHKADEFVYMTASPADLTLTDPQPLPAPFALRAYQPGDEDMLAGTYFPAFEAGSDQSFLEKTEEQRRAIFEGYFSQELNQGASMVLLEGGEVRGFSLIHSRQRVGDQHLALVAVAPESQNQGWGRILLSESIRAGIAQGHDYFSIGVDLANPTACHLYASLGFEVQTKLVNHLWKGES